MAEPDNVTDINDSREEHQTPSSRPVASFNGSGGMNVAVWKNRSEGTTFDNYSIRIDRTYKDTDGTFKSTPYLRDSDLLRARKLLDDADNWIEQDKGRNRSAGAGRG